MPPLDLPELDASDYFSAAAVARAHEYRRLTRGLWLGGLVLELAVLALVAWKGRGLAAALRPRVRGRVRTAAALAAVAVFAVSAATLPLGAVAHWWSRRYGLSEQRYGWWLLDQVIGFGVRAALVAVAAAGAVALAARFGRSWWAYGGAALAVLGALFVLAQPLVIGPLFNRFEPVRDERLARDIRVLAERMGVDVDTVQVTDASRRTTAANAYVAGIGPTRRVVLYDTILGGRFTHDEILAISAHELAHVERRHLWKGVAWFALLAVPGVFLIARATDRRGGLSDPALVPLALLVAFVAFVATLPLQNAVSRRYEAEADWLALHATGEPEATIDLEVRLVRTSLGDPTPPAWTKLFLATHPAPIERIAMAKVVSRSVAARGGS